MKKFKLVYDKTPKDGKLNGSITGVPTSSDTEIVLNNITNNTKLIYEDTKRVENRKAVPTSGYIDRIYINIGMPAEEVLKKLINQTGSVIDRMKNILTKEEFDEWWALPSRDEKDLYYSPSINIVLCISAQFKLSIEVSNNMISIQKCIGPDISQTISSTIFLADEGWIISEETNIFDGFTSDGKAGYIDVKNNWTTKEDLAAIIEKPVHDSLWKPGFYNEQYKDIFYIKTGDDFGNAKKIKILKASEQTIPTDQDKEICTLADLIESK